MLLAADVFVFTLGMTEAWTHAPSGTIYPTAPGVISGHYDPAVHQFRNFGYQEVYEDLRAFIALAKQHNPRLKVLLTVSPVPMTATAGGHHVLFRDDLFEIRAARRGRATSKRRSGRRLFSCIRGSLQVRFTMGRFFENNRRSVRAESVAAVMSQFLSSHDENQIPPATDRPQESGAGGEAEARQVSDLECEDVLLDAFAR